MDGWPPQGRQRGSLCGPPDIWNAPGRSCSCRPPTPTPPGSKALQGPQIAVTGFWHIPGSSTVILPWRCCEIADSVSVGSGTYTTQERGHFKKSAIAKDKEPMCPERMQVSCLGPGSWTASTGLPELGPIRGSNLSWLRSAARQPSQPPPPAPSHPPCTTAQRIHTSRDQTLV